MSSAGIDKKLLTSAFQAVKGVKIPSIPKILLALQQELNCDEPNQQKIISLISEDISLSGKVIQNINSAAFGLKTEVTSIDHATIILGIRNLRDMIVSVALRKSLEDTLPGFVDVSEYSNKIGVTARLIACENALPDPESAFIVGLFHRAGTMILMQKFDEYSEIYSQYQNDPDALIKREMALFGSTHSMVSFILAYHWKLPALVSQAIALYLTEVDSIDNDNIRSLVAAVQLAGYLLKLQGDNFDETESSLAIRRLAMKELNIDEDSLIALSERSREV